MTAGQGRARLVLAAAVTVVALTAALTWFVLVRPGATTHQSTPAPPRASGILVVGDPGADAGTGAVDVHYSDGSSQRLTPASLGIPVVKGMRFGAAVTVGNLNDDTPSNNDTSGPDLSDLLIGADGGWPAPVTPGGAWLLLRSPGGRFDRSGLTALTSAGGRAGGFGHAVAFGSLVNPRDGYEWIGADIWVGAPGTTVGGAPGAGAVHRFRLRAGGSLDADEVLTQDLPQITGVAEPGDGFGEVLVSEFHGVYVGTPHEDVHGVPDAGVVHRIQTNRRTFNLRFGYGVGRGVGGIPGPAGPHDLFGAAISDDGRLVGIPGATVDGLAGAGAVQEITPAGLSADGLGIGIGAGRLIVRGDGAPGRPAAGERFGSAVVTGTFGGCRSSVAAIGAPGARVGRRTGAGTVTVIGTSYADCQNELVSGLVPLLLAQGSGLPGTPGSQERTGATLGVVGSLESGGDALLIDVPGETVGGHGRPGRVVMIAWQLGRPRGLPIRSTVFGPLDDDRDGAGFGSVLASSAYG